MRALNILSGIAVLFATFGFLHILAHTFHHQVWGLHRALILALMGVGVLSFIGGCLLIRRPQ